MIADKDILIVKSEIVKGSRRTVTTLIQKKSWAKIYAHLTPSMQDASKEIELVFTHLTNGMGYPITDLNHVKGHKELDPSEYITSICKKYKDWRKFPPAYTGKVIDMFAYGKTLDELENIYGYSKKTIMKHIKEGLNHYCIISGWGDQLKTA